MTLPNLTIHQILDLILQTNPFRQYEDANNLTETLCVFTEEMQDIIDEETRRRAITTLFGIYKKDHGWVTGFAQKNATDTLERLRYKILPQQEGDPVAKSLLKTINTLFNRVD